MLVVTAKFTVKPGKKPELMAAAKELIAATRQESGCISYALLEDPYRENGFMFFEEWVDKAALDQHFTTPHIAEWRRVAAGLREGQSELTMYQAEVLK